MASYGRLSTLFMSRQNGGEREVHRIAPEATAMSLRKHRLGMHLLSMWENAGMHEPLHLNGSTSF
jgi:hypothetical protein